MSMATLVSFWGLSLIFVIIPGADWAYTISASLRGRHIPAVSGLILGYLVMTTIVALGVGSLVAEHTTVMMLLTFAGALYLIWLGLNMLRQSVEPLVSQEDTRLDSGLSAAAKGALVSGLNPKAFLFFLAFLPAFTVAEAVWSLPVQLFTLGMIYTLSCLVIYMLLGYGAHRVLSTRPEATLIVSRLSGGVMLLLGLFLLYRQLSGD